MIQANKPIARVSVADHQVYGQPRQSILSGGLGERIVEIEVASELNTSRAPVRGPLNRLIQEDLLEARTHLGPSVVRMIPEKIKYLYDVRIAIVTLAVREICRKKSVVNLTRHKSVQMSQHTMVAAARPVCLHAWRPARLSTD